MAAVDVTISGVLFDKLNRTTQNVVLIGEASLTGVGVGGGPIIPPGTQPPQSPGVPTHPIALPGDPWWGDPHPAHPIVIPPPSWQPPTDFTPPPPGSTAPVGPPVQPVHPIVIPDFILINYPGYGWIAVGKPVPPEGQAPPSTGTAPAKK